MTADPRDRQTVPPAALFAAALGAQQLMGGARKNAAGAVAFAVLTAVAGWFGFGSVTEFRKSQTTVDPMEVGKASTLVTTGPNAITRNPMYVALLLTLLANAARRGRISGYIPAGLFYLAIDRLQIPKEEAALERVFGPDYDRYRHSTPRWLKLPWEFPGS